MPLLNNTKKLPEANLWGQAQDGFIAVSACAGGHGVGSICDSPTTAKLIQRLKPVNEQAHIAQSEKVKLLT